MPGLLLEYCDYIVELEQVGRTITIIISITRSSKSATPSTTPTV
jgi:hypothetical protein